ncbi:MAG: hypothetical protein V1835_01020 [Candidatus Micrarchaeota archaeon]
MRPNPILILFLFLPAAGSFSEFNYLFPEGHSPGAYTFLITPKSCRVFDFAFQPMESSLIPSDSPAVFGNFENAKAELHLAKKFNRYYPSLLDSSPGFGGLMSFYCFSHGIDAVNHASAAMRASFSMLDSKFTELDLLQGDQQIFSFGLQEEKAEVEAEIKANNPKGSFSNRVLSASKNISILWRDFPFSVWRFNVLADILGDDGALSEAAILATKVDLSISKLQEMHLNSSRNYDSALFDAEDALNSGKAQKLSEIKQKTLGLRATAPIISTTASKPSFFEEQRELESMLKKAKLLHTESTRAMASKQRGYLAYSVLQKQAANSLLLQIFARANEMDVRAEALERALNIEIDAIEQQAQDAISSKLQDPLIFSYLKSKFQKYGQEKAAFDYAAARGGRINALGNLLNSLNSILEAASASDVVAFKLSGIKGKTESLKSLLVKAKADGIDVAQEENSLSQIGLSLQNIRYESDSQLIFQLDENLDSLKNSVLLKASNEFPDLQEDYWKLESQKDYLPVEDRLSIEKYSKFFNGGKLDYEAALGKLAAMRALVGTKSGELEAKKPALISAQLEGLLAISEAAEPAAADVPIKFTVTILLENPAGLDAKGARIKLPLPIQSKLVNGSEGVGIEKARDALYLCINDVKEYYFAVLEYDLVANSLTSDEKAVISSDFQSIVLRETVRFKTSKSSELLLEFDALSDDFEIEYRGAYSKRVADGKLSLVIDAAPGENMLEVTFRLQDPFSLYQQAKSEDGVSAIIDFEYTNNAIDAPFSEIEYSAYTQCRINRVLLLQSDFEFIDHSSQNYLVFSLKTKEWKKSEIKRVSLKLVCDNAISSLLQTEMLNSNTTGLLLQSLALENSKQQLSEGNFAEALSLLKVAGIASPIAPVNAATISPSSQIGTSAPVPNLLYEKQLALEGYPGLMDDSEAASKDFATYFEAGDSLSRSLSTNTVYKSALSSKTALEKLLKELQQINNAVSTNSSEKYSVGYIRERLSAAVSALAALKTSSQKMKELAETEFSELQKRQKQFGGNENTEEVNAASDAFDGGKYFTSYMLAKNLNSRLLPPAAQKGTDYSIYAIPSIAILLGLSYFMLFRKNGEAIIGKPMED